ncbi:hypothetical protein RCL_jg9840.t1 [Rhizophagus clarus]|uniref:Uncharacterized protein n=1 Tax=Rhizophagus clarus TaxID=94130 RepID=A0A8H3M0T8_9GLOM|nr:hypothetical protein RCL_jg9840.t1 [Rhizophagus clarus]
MTGNKLVKNPSRIDCAIKRNQRSSDNVIMCNLSDLFIYGNFLRMDVFFNLWMRLKSDYEDAFKIMDNGTIRATNDSIMKVQGFLIRYHSVLRSEGLEVRELDLESAGRREIEVINKTKKEMIKLALVECRDVSQTEGEHTCFSVLSCFFTPFVVNFVLKRTGNVYIFLTTAL